jgi:hypothetical protein
MNIQELHYSFNLKIDKVDSLSVDSFNDAERDWLLNYTIDVFVKQRYGVTNNKQYGFEAITKRRDDLRSLHQKQFEITPTLFSADLYEAPLNGIINPTTASVPRDYWFCTRLRADIQKGTCIKNVEILETQTDDLNSGLKYNFYKPSFKWGRVLSTFNDDTAAVTNPDDILGSVFLHTDGFEVTKVYIDYVKRPSKVWLGTYTPLNGVTPAAAVQCDLPDHTHEELTTLAAYLAQGLIADPNFQALRQQYLEIE